MTTKVKVDLDPVTELSNKTLIESAAFSPDTAATLLACQVLQAVVIELRDIKHILAEFVGHQIGVEAEPAQEHTQQ